MEKILVFAGTTEGREVSEYLGLCGANAAVYTVTEYGKSLVFKGEGIEVVSKGLNEEEIKSLVSEGGFYLVIDATHPFAKEATINIKEACHEAGVRYIRLLRESGLGEQKGVVFFGSCSEAAEYLNLTKGNILFTTGSKEIEKFALIDGFNERAYVRVLPLAAVLEKCLSLGLDAGHIICAKGPFSEEMNRATIKHTNARYIVTKETGTAGGYDEKISAALSLGVVPIVIKRPVEGNGLSFEELKAVLKNDYGIKPAKKVYVIGIGPGERGLLSEKAEKAIKTSDIVIGSKRAVGMDIIKKQRVFEEINAEKIFDIVKAEDFNICSVLFSGDTGFYSGAQGLMNFLEEYGIKFEVINGISSFSYFFGKIHKSYQNVEFLSLHGRDCDYINSITHNKGVFIILGGENDVSKVCGRIVSAGLRGISVYVGENLSYDDESIKSGAPEDFVYYKNRPLSVVYIENSTPKIGEYKFGINDGEFVRSSVPMTKSEVRAVSMSRLGLNENSVVFDVGAGTGSVSVEAALMAFKGRVFAFEKNPEAIELIKENTKKFSVKNVEIIEGTAPETFEKAWEKPTHCFIGGSAGNMARIVKQAAEINPKIRFVINAVTLESALEAKKAAALCNADDLEISLVSVSRCRFVGDLTMMNSINPVFVISFTADMPKC